MNRRAFLSSILGAIAASTLPKPKAKPKLAAPERVSIRMIRKYDRESGTFTNRMDVLYGIGTISPQYACVVVG